MACAASLSRGQSMMLSASRCLAGCWQPIPRYTWGCT